MPMIAVGLFCAAFILALAAFGVFFIIAGVEDLRLGDFDGFVPLLFGVVLLLGAASFVAILFVPA